MGPVRHRGDDAVRAPTPASEREEEIWMLMRIDDEARPVRADHRELKHIVHA